MCSTHQGQAHRHRWITRLRMFCMLFMLAGACHAAYPERPVTIVVPAPPGAGTDAIPRMLIPRLSEIFKQTFLVENRPGASGNIATDYVVRATPNGETILINNGTMTANAALGVEQRFDLQKDLTPIMAIGKTPVALAVSSTLPVYSVQELIDYGKAHPGALSFSSCGTGTLQHFAGVEFAHRTGINMVHVPYNGCGPALVAGIGDQVPVMFNVISTISPQLQTGKIRLLAMATKDRLPLYPDVPTVAELLGVQNYDFAVWQAFFVPAKTPQSIVDQLRTVLMALAQEEATRTWFSDRLIVPMAMDGPELQALIATELESWKARANRYNIVAD